MAFRVMEVVDGWVLTSSKNSRSCSPLSMFLLSPIKRKVKAACKRQIIITAVIVNHIFTFHAPETTVQAVVSGKSERQLIKTG